MSSLRRFNRGRFMGATAAAAGSAGFVQISASQTKPASGAQFTSAAGNVIPFSKANLYARGSVRSFNGAQLTGITFPLGGVGTGTIGLGGRGNLRDWEIFNRSNKGGALPLIERLWIFGRQQNSSERTR